MKTYLRKWMRFNDQDYFELMFQPIEDDDIVSKYGEEEDMSIDDYFDEDEEDEYFDEDEFIEDFLDELDSPEDEDPPFEVIESLIDEDNVDTDDLDDWFYTADIVTNSDFIGLNTNVDSSIVNNFKFNDVLNPINTWLTNLKFNTSLRRWGLKTKRKWD